MYAELADIVSEEALLAAGKQVAALPKASDPYFVRKELPPTGPGSPQYRSDPPGG
jgi:hypothetical protein